MPIKERLIESEGYRRMPYIDTVGKITIGVGFNITDVGLYPEEIEFILDNRIKKATEAAEKIPVYKALDPVRQSVLVDMVYNMGLTSVLTFKQTLAYLEKKQWNLASEQMLKSKWAQQTGRRAVNLAKIIREGIE